MYWKIVEDGFVNIVRYGDSYSDVVNLEGDYYEDEIYTQRHLQEWTHRGDEHTMICVDTNTDGNKFLHIFDNDKEIK